MQANSQFYLGYVGIAVVGGPSSVKALQLHCNGLGLSCYLPCDRCVSCAFWDERMELWKVDERSEEWKRDVNQA